jgi:hypothetical protein
LRYNRSRFFIFLFFLQQLSGISLGKNNNSCSVFRQESNKIRFAVFRFLYNFLQNLQDSAKVKQYLRCCFARKSLEVLIPYRYALSLRIGPQKELKSCNVVLRGVGRRGSPEFRRSGGRGRPGTGGGRLGGHLGSIWKVGRGGDAAGDGHRRRTRAAAAVACSPTRGGAMRGEEWLLEPLRSLEGVPEGSVDRGCKRRRSLPSGSNGGRQWTGGCTGRLGTRED